MSHAVHYRDPSGDSHLEDRPSLAAALELVERLRNEDGATDVRVFREVPIEVKTYYRVVAVEAGDEPGVVGGGHVAAVADAAPVAPAPVAPEPVANGHVATDPAAGEPSAAAEQLPSGLAEVPRPAPSEPPSGATVMSPPPATVAANEEPGDDPDAEPRAEHRRQLFSRS